MLRDRLCGQSRLRHYVFSARAVRSPVGSRPGLEIGSLAPANPGRPLDAFRRLQKRSHSRLALQPLQNPRSQSFLTPERPLTDVIQLRLQREPLCLLRRDLQAAGLLTYLLPSPPRPQGDDPDQLAQVYSWICPVEADRVSAPAPIARHRK